MAPNIPLSAAIGRESEEIDTSKEVIIELPNSDTDVGVGLPRIFNSHLEQQFQDQDSPNLHQIPGQGDFKVPSRTATKPVLTHATMPLLSPPDTLRTRMEFHPRNTKRRFDGQTSSTGDSQSSPSFIQGTVLPRTFPTLTRRPSSNRKVIPTSSTSEDDQRPSGSRVLQVPATRIPGRVPPGQHTSENTNQQSTKGTTPRPTLEDIATATYPPSSAEPSSSSTTYTTRSHHDFGVLKLPGHEPEAPADLNLVHHDRAIDTRNQTGLGGIYVQDGGNFLTPEGATALILVGLCSVFLVFICFIMFVQKIRQQRLNSKVVQDDDDVKKPKYDATASSTAYLQRHQHHQQHQPNPLSFLPPEILHALMQPGATGTAAEEKYEVYEEPKPAFLTMEPPLSGNQLGCLWFSVYYDYVKSTLVLHILHARYVKGRGASTNPGMVWVEACVLTPMNTIKASNKTDTRRASLAPVFNQSFKFQVTDEEVTQYLLRLTLYDKHPSNGEKAVGSVIVPLSTVDLCSTETISRELQ